MFAVLFGGLGVPQLWDHINWIVVQLPFLTQCFCGTSKSLYTTCPTLWWKHVLQPFEPGAKL